MATEYRVRRDYLHEDPSFTPEVSTPRSLLIKTFRSLAQARRQAEEERQISPSAHVVIESREVSDWTVTSDEHGCVCTRPAAPDLQWLQSHRRSGGSCTGAAVAGATSKRLRERGIDGDREHH